MKRRKIALCLMGASGLVAVVVLVATLFYPYSTYSLHKSFPFKPYKVTNEEGKTYKQRLAEFRVSYEKDRKQLMEKEEVNRTVTSTQFLMESFEEDWLVSKEPVAMNLERFETMVFKLQTAREALLGLLASEKYTIDQKQQLVQIIVYIDSVEDDIDLTCNGNLSRGETKTMLGNLYVDHLNLFMFYSDFYEGVME